MNLTRTIFDVLVLASYLVALTGTWEWEWTEDVGGRSLWGWGRRSACAALCGGSGSGGDLARDFFFSAYDRGRLSSSRSSAG